MPNLESDEQFMRQALVLAARAYALDEVPVGAVLVREGEVLGEGWNCPIVSHDATAHAEIVALRAAADRVQNYRLPDTTLYVTIEPCTMCVGALVHARVKRIVYGATEPKAGVLVSNLRILEAMHWNHYPSVTGGVCGDEASALIKRFFLDRRQRAKKMKAAALSGR